ncbi:hypothetical protein K490DRAFT_59513 [Saccharata proteae CBS 121410]|uniref:Uncharacterized protein n=1 Tax=Saccharata proteae CBS 121410 TaxID=1314787 RepID=A0A9P4HRC6_9PEZI|nr:hypothetical protein K490DRAFT_59513 [Saccharata proteae CBS 121410]
MATNNGTRGSHGGYGLGHSRVPFPLSPAPSAKGAHRVLGRRSSRLPKGQQFKDGGEIYDEEWDTTPEEQEEHEQGESGTLKQHDSAGELESLEDLASKSAHAEGPADCEGLTVEFLEGTDAALREEEEDALPLKQPQSEPEGLDRISQKLDIKNLLRNGTFKRSEKDAGAKNDTMAQLLSSVFAPFPPNVRQHIYSYLVKEEWDVQFKPLHGNAVLYKTSHRMYEPATSLISSPDPAAELPANYFRITTFSIELTDSAYDFTGLLMREPRFASLLTRIEKLEIIIRWATPEILDHCRDPTNHKTARPSRNKYATSTRHHRLFSGLDPASAVPVETVMKMNHRVAAITKLLDVAHAPKLRMVKISWVWNRWVELPIESANIIRGILRPLQSLIARKGGNVLLVPGRVWLDLLGKSGDLGQQVKRKELPGLIDEIIEIVMSVCLGRGENLP